MICGAHHHAVTGEAFSYRQNTAYSQPSYTDFYFASDMDYRNVPLRAAQTPGSVQALREVLAGLVESGDVSGPAASQLTASVQQALKAVDDGDSAKAAQAIGRFADFLDQQKKPDQVSDAARTALDYNAGNILRAFEG